MTKVILSKSKGYTTQDIKNTVEEGMTTIHNDNFDYSTILIKPNLCYYWDYSTGQTTDPRVVKSIIEYIRENNKDVTIYIGEADASAMKTKYSFKMLGYEELAKEKNVELINLSQGEKVEKEASINEDRISLPINRRLAETDMLINVPTLKTHREIGFTCAMKNIFGSIANPWKYGYHKYLSQTIVAINKIVKSNIVIVDGIIASGKTPKKMGIIITGDDAYSTDKIVSELIGYRASKVPYLNLAKKEGLEIKGQIEIIEKSIKYNEIKKAFPKPNYLLDEIIWKSELRALKLYAKIVGDIIPPVLDGV
ncbi:MAG: DUF362 domain-containing protein [Candidatus Hodarchaeales archaeon]